ncbi:hypothetical protein ACFIJ5_04380 [Haloimpatiens sp. FM7330]|uniref:hypothetical protein n=1 Tax=Haloimpatiens sp. FM7330 TaxID=3298610 RepID=UPI00363BF62D
MEENKKMLFLMLVFGVIGYLIMTNMFNLPIKSVVIRTYAIMGIPWGIKILKKIQPNFLGAESILLLAAISPIILILAICIGVFALPYFLINLTFGGIKAKINIMK